MNKLLPTLQRYLDLSLGIRIEPEPWDGQVPPFLRDVFEIYTVQLLNHPLLLLLHSHETEIAPVALGKQIASIRRLWPHEVALVRRHLSAYSRKKLIESGISFIIPEKQLFLPEMAVWLKESKSKAIEKRDFLRPSSQLLFLYLLLTGIGAKNTRETADRLHCSAMSISRAYDELEHAGLIRSTLTGRRRSIEFAESPRTLWKDAGSILRTPVVRQTWLSGVHTLAAQYPAAGLSALSAYTVLAPPSRRVIAMNRSEFKETMRSTHVMETPAAEEDSIGVEIWRYPPRILAREGLVDPLSLYLSQCGSSDDRIQDRLEDLLAEHVEW